MILIVSLVGRMLAELAVREGHEVVALDHFGDLDVQRLCPSVSILRDLGGRGGMAGLVAEAERIPAAAVVYGAGLENRPDLVARLAGRHTVLGCTPETLRRVRDPGQLGPALRAAGFAYPRTFVGERPPAGGTRWLRKPLRGGAGRGVREWRGGAIPDGVLVQERVSGLPVSATAVGDGRAAALLGVSEQLIGRAELGARGYTWCGNLVPPRLQADERRGLARTAWEICTHLAAEFGVRGLFGVDMVWDGERPWVVEVNPRPTAALETIATVHGGRPFSAHLEGSAGRLPVTAYEEPHAAAGKAVLFAAEELRLADTRGWWARGIRDVPHPGERIGAHHPVCTLLATGSTPEAVLDTLQARAAALRAELRTPAHALT